MVLYSLDEQVLELKLEKGLKRKQAVFTFDMVEFGEMDYTILVTEEQDVGSMIFCNDHLIWSDPDVQELVNSIMRMVTCGIFAGTCFTEVVGNERKET
jgi:hypothetical protein